MLSIPKPLFVIATVIVSGFIALILVQTTVNAQFGELDNFKDPVAEPAPPAQTTDDFGAILPADPEPVVPETNPSSAEPQTPDPFGGLRDPEPETQQPGNQPFGAPPGAQGSGSSNPISEPGSSLPPIAAPPGPDSTPPVTDDFSSSFPGSPFPSTSESTADPAATPSGAFVPGGTTPTPTPFPGSSPDRTTIPGSTIPGSTPPSFDPGGGRPDNVGGGGDGFDRGTETPLTKEEIDAILRRGAPGNDGASTGEILDTIRQPFQNNPIDAEIAPLRSSGAATSPISAPVRPRRAAPAPTPLRTPAAAAATRKVPLNSGDELGQFASLFWRYLKANNYKNWAPAPGTDGDFARSDGTHGELAKHYFNRAAASNMADPPFGSVIVMESYDDSRTLISISVMLRSDRFHPDGGDWYWVDFNPDGSVRQDNRLKLTGRIESCIQCHDTAGSGDYMFINDRR